MSDDHSTLYWVALESTPVDRTGFSLANSRMHYLYLAAGDEAEAQHDAEQFVLDHNPGHRINRAANWVGEDPEHCPYAGATFEQLDRNRRS
jgi:hypothetical protein